MQPLPTVRTLNGKHDAYCHVCWEAVYALWVDDEPPDNSRCMRGDYDAVTCPEARGRNRLRAGVARYRRGERSR